MYLGVQSLLAAGAAMIPKSKTEQRVSPTRRHFLRVSAATARKVAAMAALATILPSSGQAANGGNGNHYGWGNGGGGGGHCFLRGTRILTPQGEVCIEDLRTGDLVETVRGEAMPIKWIGRNTFKKSGSSWPESIVPIRVSRFAIEAQTPHTDLYLSPGHALFIDGLLMP